MNLQLKPSISKLLVLGLGLQGLHLSVDPISLQNAAPLAAAARSSTPASAKKSRAVPQLNPKPLNFNPKPLNPKLLRVRLGHFVLNPAPDILNPDPYP